MEELILPLFTHDMSYMWKNLKKITGKILRLINKFIKLQDTRSIYKNQLYFYILAIKKSKDEIKKTNP